jgi:hypothetical protein
VNISISSLSLKPIMGQQQQKMKMFDSNSTTTSPKGVTSDQPLFANTSNIGSRSADIQNRPESSNGGTSAFQTFLKIAPTKS